jgi:hypothetical protein
MDWSVKPHDEANHNPIAIVSGDRSRQVLSFNAAPGSVIRLNANRSEDPDGDALTYHWYTLLTKATYA